MHLQLSKGTKNQHYVPPLHNRSIDMDNNIGELIKQLRIDKGLSQQQVANLCNRSRESISKFEKGTRNPTDDFLIELSIILEFDFVTYINELNNFKKVEHFIITCEFITSIHTDDNDRIRELIQSDIVQKEFTYGEPLALKQYCTTYLLINVDNNPTETLKLCMSYLEIDDIQSFKPKINQVYAYYSTINNLALALYKLNDFDNLLTLSLILVDYFETVYFNDIVPLPKVDLFYKQYYITCLCGLAGTYLTLKDTQKALETCTKAIKKSNEFQVTNVIHNLLNLKVQILCTMNNYFDAKLTYTQFKAFCEITDRIPFFEHHTTKLQQQYPLLFK